jgi:predicted nucleic acid-binding protein
MTFVVIDTNLFFAALRTPNNFVRDTLDRSDLRFIAPNFLVVELFKYKDELVTKSKVTEDEVYELLSLLLHRITFINESAVSLGNIIHAYRLCTGVDEKDTPFVALALEYNAQLWTRDRELKDGLSAKGFLHFFEA